VKPVIFHQDAEAEFYAAVAYYEDQRQGLGADLQSEIEHAVHSVQLSPQTFPRHGDQGVQKCVVRRFPYTLFILELYDYIWIVAVAHQKRRPGYWTKRAQR